MPDDDLMLEKVRSILLKTEHEYEDLSDPLDEYGLVRDHLKTSEFKLKHDPWCLICALREAAGIPLGP